MRRRRVLFATPVIPADRGNGAAMRASATLRVLAAHHDVTLLVVPRWPSPVAAVPADLTQACRQVLQTGPTSVPRPRATLGARWRVALGLRSGGRLRDAPFDVVHVFRLVTVPLVAPWLDPPLGPPPRRHLDLDDIESRTYRRIADLLRRRGREEDARREEEGAVRSAAREAEHARTFDRIYVASPDDVAALPADARGLCLPNVVQPVARAPPPPRDGPFVLFFVGTLDYVPNEDAVLWFAQEVLPLLRVQVARRVSLVVVGARASPALCALPALHPEISLPGPLEDLAPSYGAAHVAVAPIRAGGGTRIKILEAFAHRRPVVSTTLGAEGLAVADGRHLLLADDAPAFAAACARLAREPELAGALVDEAARFVALRHVPAVLESALADLDAEVRPRSEDSRADPGAPVVGSRGKATGGGRWRRRSRNSTGSASDARS